MGKIYNYNTSTLLRKAKPFQPRRKKQRAEYRPDEEPSFETSILPRPLLYF